jgi:TRAP-type C4-dicarboxylate transport system substrate-binding protein
MAFLENTSKLTIATVRDQINTTARIAAAAFILLLPFAAAAEPVTLKLSFFTSDRSVAYLTAVKPFVDAINSEGEGLIKIDVYFSGTLGKVQRELPQLVLDGTADIAFIVPGQNPDRFPDNTVIELPGLFRDVREATLTYSRLVAANTLAGYKDFFVIGAFATQPETIHSRKPIRSLVDLTDQKIRTNNATEATALAKLGALPVVLAFNETGPAISSGALDGATVPTAQLFDVGIGRLTSNHYRLRVSVAPLALVLSRQVFDRLPEAARNLIRKYSGEWSAVQFSDGYEKIGRKVLDEVSADNRRNIVTPSTLDQLTAQRAFKTIIRDWASASVHNRDLLQQTETELAKIRQAELGNARAEAPKDQR